VTLVATDNEGLSDDVTTTITVVGAPAPSTVNHVASVVNQGNVTTPNATIPATAAVGDRLIMILTLNANNRVMSDPTGVTGWTVLGTETTAGMASRIYTKVVAAGDAGKRVTVPIDLASKYTMTIAEYSGVRNVVPQVTGAVETVNQMAQTQGQFLPAVPLWGLPRDLGLKGAIFADAGTLFGYKGKKFFDVNGDYLISGFAPTTGCVVTAALTVIPECVSVLDNHKIRSSVGASLLWNSPLGPIRFDYAFALSKEEGVTSLVTGLRTGGDRTQLRAARQAGDT